MAIRNVPNRLIEDTGDIQTGIARLRRRCPHMRRAYAAAGEPPLRRDPGGFPGLCHIVVGQMVSLASAEAIWRRLVARLAPFEARGLLAMSETDLRGVGLSGPKIRTLRAVAQAVDAADLDFAALEAGTDAEVRTTLMAVSGVGPWTADIYLLFCLGRADAFAAGDLALQVAAGHLMGLGTRPSPTELEAIAERWRPWRGVAARQLWAYYRVIKGRSGQPL
ncbi:MAG: DNA-3-methyladenine glycosylase 2 family protein [Hyphomicrobiaceae bacterium]